MPAQTVRSKVPKYAVGDTAPPLELLITDGNDEAIDLSGSTAVINIAYASRSYYYSPMKRLIDGGACVIDPDQVTNTGWISWEPQPGDLSIAGTFRYSVEVTFPDGTRQTFAPDVNNTFVVRAPAGGMQYA